MNMIDLATYAAVKKLGGGGGGASAYTAKSIDELPSNAVDGSIAIIDGGSIGIGGTWYLNDEIALPSGELNQMFFVVATNASFGAVQGEQGCLYFCSKISGVTKSKELVYENGVWEDETYRTIVIDDDPVNSHDANFVAWLKANAVMLKPEMTGYWRFKDEIEFEGIDYYVNFISYDNLTGLRAHGNIYDDGATLMFEGDYASAAAFKDGKWVKEDYKTICLYAGCEDDFATWLCENADKIIPSQLYIHENGEWVYKGEVA